ncbi:MAG: DoxX family protein [Alphaproteobacteria bacterium]|nr:DoxX family protein [Alphaproteobacteria bacterium]
MYTETISSYPSGAIGAALLRTVLGALLLSHGLLKVLVFTVAGTVAFFGELGLPPVVAYLTIFGEIAGGLALVSGVMTRPAALLSLPILTGALWAHSGNGWVFSNQGGGWEFPALLAVLAVIVAVQGAGAFALGSKLAASVPVTRLLPRWAI